MFFCQDKPVDKTLVLLSNALLSHQRHLRILRAQLPAHLAGGREAHADATHMFHRKLLLRRNTSTGKAGMKRTEVAKAHALTIAQTVDYLRLQGVKHGLHVSRSNGTRSRDVFSNFINLHGSHRNRTRVVSILFSNRIFSGNK